MNTTSSSPLYRVHQQGDIRVVEFLLENLDPGAVEEVKLELRRIVTGSGVPGDSALSVGGGGGAARKLVLDLNRVRHVPSRLLGVLMETNQLLTGQRGQMRICGLQPMIMDVFKFMRLDTVLKVTATREEAVKSF